MMKSGCEWLPGRLAEKTGGAVGGGRFAQLRHPDRLLRALTGFLI